MTRPYRLDIFRHRIPGFGRSGTRPLSVRAYATEEAREQAIERIKCEGIAYLGGRATGDSLHFVKWELR